MSWSANGSREDVKSFRQALEDASSRGIAMFCMAWDGETADSEQLVYPASFEIPGLYRVGAVYGNEWPSAEVRRKRNIDLVLPGQFPEDANASETPRSGVAPAIATGLAALVVFCATSVMPFVQNKPAEGESGMIISAFVSYIKRHQDTEQNLSINAGWDGFEEAAKQGFEDFANSVIAMVQRFQLEAKMNR